MGGALEARCLQTHLVCGISRTRRPTRLESMLVMESMPAPLVFDRVLCPGSNGRRATLGPAAVVCAVFPVAVGWWDGGTMADGLVGRWAGVVGRSRI